MITGYIQQSLVKTIESNKKMKNYREKFHSLAYLKIKKMNSVASRLTKKMFSL